MASSCTISACSTATSWSRASRSLRGTFPMPPTSTVAAAAAAAAAEAARVRLLCRPLIPTSRVCRRLGGSGIVGCSGWRGWSCRCPADMSSTIWTYGRCLADRSRSPGQVRCSRRIVTSGVWRSGSMRYRLRGGTTSIASDMERNDGSGRWSSGSRASASPSPRSPVSAPQPPLAPSIPFPWGSTPAQPPSRRHSHTEARVLKRSTPHPRISITGKRGWRPEGICRVYADRPGPPSPSRRPCVSFWAR
mmetsp:Transcript_17765/g.50486  ORF Transcript_17765/g.50486 Transcript_17765/m.50486 type:complete len:248 (+) Transcript_17765:1267-2010(+)